eukprot:sb/3473791/
MIGITQSKALSTIRKTNGEVVFTVVPGYRRDPSAMSLTERKLVGLAHFPPSPTNYAERTTDILSHTHTHACKRYKMELQTHTNSLTLTIHSLFLSHFHSSLYHSLNNILCTSFIQSLSVLLLNQILSLSLSPDGVTAVVQYYTVHK